tara:strand:+ start:770 stop:1153 length:384 start_codon:yes stop_codon:yes gene_type:complete
VSNKKDINYEKLYTLARMGLSEEQIAQSLGISVSTIGRRKKDDERFDDTLKAGKLAGIEIVTNALFNSATNPEKPNTSAQIFFLKNRAGWRDKSEVDQYVEGKLELDIDVEAALKSIQDAGLDPADL